MMQDETSLASFSIQRLAAASAQGAYQEAGGTPARHGGERPAAYDARRSLQADTQIIHIRLADSQQHQEATSLLIRKMYGWRGYAVDGDGSADGGRITLLAESRGVVVGTMGLCLDGELGLPADDHFRSQIDLLRAQGRRLCEPSRLAIDAGMSKRVFASMIHVSYLYAHVLQGYTDYVIEVNPRHVVFYQRMLGFERVGPQRACRRVGAPAVLLRLPLSYMAAQIRACGGRPDMQQDARSFYPYFFAPAEEAAISERLRAIPCKEAVHG